MNITEAAAALNGSEYPDIGSRDLFAALKVAGLVAVFGGSDDLMEFRGAVHDEVGAYDGGTAFFTPSGLLVNKCEEDDCPYFEHEKKAAVAVSALCDREDMLFHYATDIPHAKFLVNEDGEIYCEGIVFALSDVPVKS